MPCLRNLTISHALQYFDDDIRKKEAKGLDYYSQEDGGVWFGKTAEELGFIDKKFNREDYHSVMKGKFTYYDKISQKNITVDLTKKSSNKEHHAGIELTLSAPKSVSITAEVFKDKRVIDAHIKAVNNVVEYIQNNFVYTRTKINGEMTFEKVDNLLATKFTHHTNRNHDPQLHTHILIANIVIDKNHNIKTAEHTTIFENERFIRELYNNELANNLIQLGYDIDWQKKITQIAPEINGIPQELNDLLSSRRKEIEKFAEEHNLNLESPTAMQFACLATRQAKDNSIGIDELSPVWQVKVKEFNIDIDKLKYDITNNSVSNNISNLSTIVKNSIEHLTERQATFTKEELICSVIDRSNGNYNVNQIENEIKQNKELINANLDIEKYSKHLKVFTDREKIVFTTKTQVAIENKIIDLVEQGQNKFKSINNISNTNNKINDVYSTLNNSQKQTVDFILDNKDQFLAIQGYAGVGKTYTIKALNEELKNKHINLIGLAPTHSAADTLKNEAGIQTNTLQSFLAKYNGYANDREISKTSLNNLKEQFKDTIILVDESSLIGNRQMKDLLTIANKFNTRVILQGDEKQLDSVEGGTPFHRLINNKHIEYSELNNILRQKDEQIKTAVQDIIKKDIVSAFNNLKANKHIIELRTDKKVDSNKFKDENLYIYNETTKKNEINKELYNEYLTFLENNSPDKIKKDLVEEVVKTYNKLTKDEKQNTLIITSSNEIRKEINSEIRQEIKQENINNNIDNNKNIILETLEYKSMTNQEKKEIQNYNINDTIIFLKDNNKLNINKNIEYHILDVDKNKKEITLQEKNDDDINKDNQKNKVIVNIDKLSNNINLFSKDKKELIINDKIKFNITDKEKGILKGSDFIVKEIDKNKIILAKDGNNTNKDDLTINLNNKAEKNLLKYIDYSYTTTTYSSQGKTSKNVIYTLESYRPILTNQKELYVGVSRTKDNITVITDNINKSINTLLGNTGEKLGAKDIETNNINNTNKANNTEQQINIEKNKSVDMEL